MTVVTFDLFTEHELKQISSFLRTLRNPGMQAIIIAEACEDNTGAEQIKESIDRAIMDVCHVCKVSNDASNGEPRNVVEAGPSFAYLYERARSTQMNGSPLYPAGFLSNKELVQKIMNAWFQTLSS